MKRRNDPSWGLYLHVPFCRGKCPYCAFYSISSCSLIPRWLAALKREIKMSSRFLPETCPAFDSIHLGGGTPSLLAGEYLAEILDCLRSCFRIGDNCETAIEADPLDITDEKAAFLKAAGFTRVVVGAQSFDERVISFLGRRHRAKDSIAAVNVLRDAGIENIGLDLIYGAEGLPVSAWISDLDEAVSLSPEHISCYCLTVEDGTVFGRLASKGRLKVSSAEAERELFLAGSRFLRDKGYIHYEVSNFASAERHMSGHNLKYWRREPYLGLGPSAHSFDGGRRWWNKRTVRGYCESLEAGDLPLQGMEHLTEEQSALEMIAMGLRIREGFKLDEVILPWIDQQGVDAMLAQGLISCAGRIIAPTVEGYLFADRLPLEITK